MRTVRLTDQITFNPDTGNHHVTDAAGNTIGDTTQRDIAYRWAGGHADNLADRAAKLGHEAGIAAASWVFDGSTSRDTYLCVLQGIEAGDPGVMDAYREPSLSGEYADDYSESDLARDLGIAHDSDVMDDAATAWAEAASATFWSEVERIARHHLDSAA